MTCSLCKFIIPGPRIEYEYEQTEEEAERKRLAADREMAEERVRWV